jgi:hypothetical protein
MRRLTRRARRQGIMPLVFAVLLTVAAGLSLAEEHVWVPATPDGAVTSSDSSSSRADPDGRETGRDPGSTGVHGQRHAGPNPGVGSRALTGHDAEEPAADVQPN